MHVLQLLGATQPSMWPMSSSRARARSSKAGFGIMAGLLLDLHFQGFCLPGHWAKLSLSLARMSSESPTMTRPAGPTPAVLRPVDALPAFCFQRKTCCSSPKRPRSHSWQPGPRTPRKDEYCPCPTRKLGFSRLCIVRGLRFRTPVLRGPVSTGHQCGHMCCVVEVSALLQG